MEGQEEMTNEEMHHEETQIILEEISNKLDSLPKENHAPVVNIPAPIVNVSSPDVKVDVPAPIVNVPAPIVNVSKEIIKFPEVQRVEVINQVTGEKLRAH